MKRFYLFALAAMVFAACATDDTQDLRPMDAPETLTVGFEGGDDDTRIQINEAGKTVWTKGDLVSVFYRSDANQKWQFQGETGERIADLYRVDAGSATETMRRVVVVYPFNENYYINTETYNVQASLPATQHYLADSYGLDGNLMISSGEYNNISLKSVCGWLKLQLVGNGEKVQSITLKGNNGEQVAGELYINSADATAILSSDKGSGDDGETGGAGGGLVFEDTILKEVTLDCGNGVELGAEATAFYIALPPQMFEKGITVEIADTSGYTMTQSTDKSLAIERNTIQPMAELAFEEKIAANQIHYTSRYGAVVTPYATDVFGANIVSNIYENGKGIITFDNKVTTIGRNAFSDCIDLTSVTIPDSVTSIGVWAFGGCTSLTSVTIGNGVNEIGDQAFGMCVSLKAFYGKFASEDNRCLIVNGTLNSFAQAGITSYTIPDSVTSIGNYAFGYCTSLTSVTIPDSVTSIGVWAFGCSSLTTITIPDSVAEIGNYAFDYCSSLTSVTIGNSVTEIAVNAFDGCTSLTAFYGKFASDDNRCLIINGTLRFFASAGVTSYAIPDSVTSIGERAFSSCTSLTSITIPDSVTEIGLKAFYNCDSLTSVTIPDGVTEIGVSAFSSCSSLTTITIPDSVAEIGNYAFDYCSSLTSVTIGNGVTKIGERAFYGCTSLTTFYGKFASEDNRCLIVNGRLNSFAPTGITSYTIPDSVTEIGEWAFNNCDSLTSITIPDSVTEIGELAFSYCRSLKEVYCKPTMPPTGGLSMFLFNDFGRRIFVPASDDDSIINAYKEADGWSDYASYIEEYDFSAGQ